MIKNHSKVVKMNKILNLMIFAMVFGLGWYSCLAYSQINFNKEFPFVEFSNDTISPADHITRDGIVVTPDYVLIYIKDAFIASYADTNSMDPTLDAESNGIEIMPSTPYEVEVGDVISYEADWTDGIVVHRVVSIDEDEQGIYYLAKGDNSPRIDSQKIRFDQIKGYLVGVVY